MDEIFFDAEEYPYYQTIRKLLYAFGDTYKNNPRTIIYMHDFVKKWLLLIIRIISDCEFKKIMEHLYSYEYSKFFNYKKLKFKNCVKPDLEENDTKTNKISDFQNNNLNNTDNNINLNSINKKINNLNADDSDLLDDEDNIDFSSKLEDKNIIDNLNLGENLDLDYEFPKNIKLDDTMNINIENPGLNMILDENCLDLNICKSDDEKENKLKCVVLLKCVLSD